MRLSTSLWLSLAIAAPISVAAAWGSWHAARGSDERVSPGAVREVGALYRFVRPDSSAAPARAEAPAAIALTASDGTGLRLATLDARAVVVGSLAFTELRLAFDNPLDRTLEGTFRVALPQGASISRFAMRQGERWQEGEVVETQRARQVYEDFLHRRQDPALLEQAAGNEFSARVFPIPARGRKELVVSYAQPLTPQAPYSLPLRGLPVVGQLDAVVSGQGDDAPILGQVHLRDAAPDSDLRVEANRLPLGDGVRAGDLALVRVRPTADVGPDPVDAAVVLVDTSASRALGFEAQSDLVAAIARGLGGARLIVGAFDQGVDVVYDGAAAGFTAAGVKSLRERQAFGASNLAGALDWAGEQARAARIRRVVLVSDGVPTMGPSEVSPLRGVARSLGAMGVERLDAVAVGGIRDDALLASLTTAGLARDGVVVDATRGAEQAVRRLSMATRKLAVKIEGATWQWPETLEGVQPGDEALVYASVPEGVTPRLSLNGQTTEVKLAPVERPLLERAWVGAKIAQLVQRPPAGKPADAVRDEIVRLSTTFRVLSPHTSLLVLETENDYARYKIDRQALADILSIDGTRLALRHRPADSTALAPDMPALAPKTGQPSSDGVVLQAPPPPPPPAAAPARGTPGAPAATAMAAPAAEPLMAEAAEAAPMARSVAKGGSGATRRAHEVDSMEAPMEAAPKRAAPAAEVRPRPVTPSPAAAASAPPDIAGLAASAGDGSPATGRLRMGSGGGVAASPTRPPSLGAPVASSGRGNELLQGDVAGLRPTVTSQFHVTQGSVASAERAITVARARARACYHQAVTFDPSQAGVASFSLLLGATGEVSKVTLTSSGNLSATLRSCVENGLRSRNFEPPETRTATLSGSLTFSMEAAPPGPPPPPFRFGPYEGELADVMQLLANQQKGDALTRAVAFHESAPGDVLGLLAVGEALEASGETRSAVRAYGSIVDLFSSRADLRRMAGSRLDRMDAPYARALAVDVYERAVAQRPDHPSSHRMLAFARLRAGDPAGAFAAIEAGVKRSYPAGRFRGVDRILREDMGLIGAAWIRADRAVRSQVSARLDSVGAKLESEPSLRFVLTWETDANDVDFHIHDDRGGHAYYGQKHLASGGDLYDDVTTGYGPECFTVRQPAAGRASYRLEAHYYSRGPMGYGMGKLEVIDHDGQGGLTFDERPFVIMQDRAFVPLGTYPASAASAFHKTDGRPALPTP